MKRISMIIVLGGALLLSGGAAAQDNDDYSKEYSLWLGGHYFQYDDYQKKIGEYLPANLDDDLLPEFRFDHLARFDGGYFDLRSHYFDDEDVNAELDIISGDRLRGSVMYRSLVHRFGQDLLDNLNSREYFPTTDSPGGKMVTSEVSDPGADYNIHRQEILAEFSGLLFRKNDVRLVAAHRTIYEDGTKQSISSNHCFSCHQISQTAEVNNAQHQLEVGVDAEVRKVDLGYRFGYRKFESDAAPPLGFYDEAKHPVSGGAVDEFKSRVQWDDTTLALSGLPETEKMSHKVRARADVGKGKVAGKIGYNRTENIGTSLEADALTGALKYTTPLGQRTRLIVRTSGARLTADDVYIDAETWRRGMTGLQYDSDTTRYSALDRYVARGSAEVIARLNRRMVLAVLGGAHAIDRDDYPVPGDGRRTTKIFGQAKWRYRKGLRYNTYLKYRFEKIDDPFISEKLFEYVGRDSLVTLPGAPSDLKFYFQREGIKYQDVTSEPTDVHVFEWRSNYRPANALSLGLGIKGRYDQNNDLDSLDVEHFSLIPDVIVNYLPDRRWALTTGYTYQYNKSRIPIAVALFDG